MAPRQRSVSTDFLSRARKQLEAHGRVGLGGMSSVGAASRARGGGGLSVLTNAGGETTAAAKGQLLVLSATGDSITSGGDYVTFDTQVHRLGFEDAISADGTTITWPVSASGSIQIEHQWDSYEGGGKYEIEVDGTVPDWGLVADASSGQEGCKRRGVDIQAGQQVKIKLTQTSGSAQTADVTVELQVQDPKVDRPGAYRDAVLKDEPLAYWRLGESSGTTATDETGNGYDATYVNTPTLGATPVMLDGYGDTAVSFAAASSEGVNGSDWADLEFDGTAAFSVEAWVRLASAAPGGAAYPIVQKDNGGSAGWELYVVAGGATARFQRTHGGTVVNVTASLTVGTNHHLVATYDGSTVRLYLDGALVDSAADANSIPTTTNALAIAKETDGLSQFFDGAIDEVAVYGKALAGTRVAVHTEIGKRKA